MYVQLLKFKYPKCLQQFLLQEMAILETLIFKNFCWGMHQTPLETGAFGARTNANDQHLGFSNLGSMYL